MTQNPNSSPNGFRIDTLVADLRPVTPIRIGRGLLLVAGMTLFAALAVYLSMGFRADIMAGAADPMFFLRLGTLVLLGVATGFAALSMSRPAIHADPRSHGTAFWKWAIGAAMLFPISALLTLLVDPALFMADFHTNSAGLCIAASFVAAVSIGGAMTWWMRRGAPTNLSRAGLLIGLSAGSFGAAAYSFHCPYSTIAYSGIWFTLAVATCALIGWMIVPRFIRW